MTSTGASNSVSSSDAIERWLVDALASLLGIDPQGIDPRERFTRYGLDSAGALKLVTALGKVLERTLPPTLLWDRPTIASLAPLRRRCGSRGTIGPDGSSVHRRARGRGRG